MPNIIITGASDGIGAELARQLARRHGLQAMLVLAARNASNLQAVAAECNALGARTLIMPTDVTDQQQCQYLVETTVRQLGSLDILINNAGVSAQALLQDVPADRLFWYEDLMRVNLWGSVYCTHTALPYLKASHGRIVAVSSLAGMVGVPGRTAYSASKFAMAGFFEALRAEVKDAGVSVTIAYPGVVRTNIRLHGLNAKGENAGVSGLREEQAMSTQECARQIIYAMVRRRREVVMTAQGKAARFIKLIFPGLVDNLALAAVKKEFQPKAH
ncbi:MAG: SDR family oxidoreductase [Betaproteobacteria bacterium]|nr:SDR family oxidoreductase [Betaproteobacteria bacterium]